MNGEAPIAFRVGTVALVGRPNVGKSTLMNAIVGFGLSIVSRRPQTTRHRILGIAHREGGQILFVDTPGMHGAAGRAMNRYMNRAAAGALTGVDLACLVCEAGVWKQDDERALRAVKDAGARFAIAPGATPALHAAAIDSGLPFLPAVATASELMFAMEQGIDTFKLFPAAVLGGTALLRAFSGPFPEARFCPTGGIDAASAPDYLALHNVLTVGGSWMAPARLVAAKDWDRISQLATEAAALQRNKG